MPNVSDLVSKIKKLIVGSNIEDLEKVSSSLKRLSPVSSSVDIATFSDLLTAIAQRDNKNVDLKFLEKDLKISNLQLEESRISRYVEYDTIVQKIPYMKRALRIITQNILSPDDFTKIALQISSDEIQDDTKKEIGRDHIERILKIYEIEDKIYDIVYNTLKWGDYFTEICIVEDILKQHKLLESEGSRQVFSEKLLESDGTVTFVVESSPSVSDIKNKAKNLEYKDFFLRYINPSRVVRLGDEFNYGYLVFNVSIDRLKNTASQNLTSAQVVNATQKILSMISKDKRFLQQHEELKYVVAKILSSNLTGEVQIRYVRPELMEHFTVQTTEFSPYGTSIFYGSEFLAKVVIAQQASIMIQRLINSVEKRIINVELGSSRNARKYLEEFKKTMMRRRISVDDLGTLNDIPSNITTFEDIYVPMMDGKAYVTIDTLPQRGDVGARVEDLKAMRDFLIASTEVPPAYVGLEENVESRALLSQENVIFAATVILYQKQISKHLTSLVHKILDLTSDDPNKKKFNIVFSPPRSLIIERLNEYYGNVSNIISTLEQLGIPREFLMEKFMLDIDLTEVKKAQTEYKLNQVFSKQEGQEGEEGLGGFGGLGGGFGGEMGGTTGGEMGGF